MYPIEGASKLVVKFVSDKEDLVQMKFSELSRTYFEHSGTYLLLKDQEISTTAKIEQGYCRKNDTMSFLASTRDTRSSLCDGKNTVMSYYKFIKKTWPIPSYGEGRSLVALILF